MPTPSTPRRAYTRNPGTVLLMANGYTLSGVARSLGVTPSTLHGYLSGARVMPDPVYAYLEELLADGADVLEQLPIRRTVDREAEAA